MLSKEAEAEVKDEPHRIMELFRLEKTFEIKSTANIFHSRSCNKNGLEKTTRWPWFTVCYRDKADYKPLEVHLEQSALRDRLGTACSCKPGNFFPWPQEETSHLNTMAEE